MGESMQVFQIRLEDVSGKLIVMLDDLANRMIDRQRCVVPPLTEAF